MKDEPEREITNFDGAVEVLMKMASGWFDEPPAPAGKSPEVLDRIGPYRILQELGRGGQATVFLAEDSRLPRKVALKVLSTTPVEAERHMRLRREAEVASRLDHPHICTVYETGIEDGLAYLAMQFVEGETLRARIRHAPDGAVSIDSSACHYEEIGDEELPSSSTASRTQRRRQVLEIVALIEKVARALHAAHEIGVLHRDVKPANIMIRTSGEPAVMDFGLAFDEESEGATLTRTGDLFGTPPYMSPEQLTRGSIHLDRRTDIWSLGVTLYECLTLERPFEAPTREALYQTILTREPANPCRRNPNVPKDLKVVLDTALSKDRDRRYQTALDFAEDLRRVRQGKAVRARPVGTIGRTLRWSRREPAKAALAVCLLVFIATGGWIAAKLPDYLETRDAAGRQRAENALALGFLQLAERARGARKHFETALEHDPACVAAVAGLAIIELKRKKPGVAIEVLEAHQGIGVDELGWIRALALRRTGKKTEADALERALGEPETALGWYALGARDLERGKAGERHAYADAYRAFDRAALAEPRAIYLFAMANAAQHTPDPADGPRVGRVLAQRWPDNAVALNWAGWSALDADPAEAERLFKRAIELSPSTSSYWCNLSVAQRDLGDLTGALESCDRAIALRHDHACAHERRGLTLIKLARTDDAIESFQKAIAQRPESPAAHRNLGNLLQKLGRIEEGLASLREAATLDPDHASGRCDLGYALMEHGSVEEAIKHLERAIQLDPKHVCAYTRLSIAYRKTGRNPDAVAITRKALQVDPTDFYSLLNFGQYLEDERKFDEATEHLERAIQVRPDHAEPYAVLARIEHHTRGNIDRAIELLRKAVAREPKEARLHRLLGIALKAGGKIEAAVTAYEASLALRPDHVRARFELGLSLSEVGNVAGAIEAYEGVIERNPEHVDARFNLAQMLVRVGRVDDAIAAYGEALRRKNLPDAHRNLAVIYNARKRYAEAERHYRALIELEPDNADTHYDLGNVVSAQGRRKESLAHYEKAIELRPMFAKAWNNKGLVFLRLGDPARAIPAFREAAKIDGKLPHPRRNLGDAHARLGQLDEAATHFRAAIALEPRHAATHVGLGMVIERQGRAEESLRHFEAAIALRENYAEAWNAKGVALTRCGERSEAITAFRKASELNPALFPPHLNLGRTLVDAGKFAEALAPLRRAIRLKSGSRSAYSILERAARKIGKLSELEAAYIEGVRARPKDARLLNAYAWFLVDPDAEPTRRDAARALRLARRAVALTDRKNVYYLDTLAVALFRSGDASGAAETQQRIVDLMNGRDAGGYSVKEALKALERYRAAMVRKDKEPRKR